jgi:hypothetical protein
MLKVKALEISRRILDPLYPFSPRNLESYAPASLMKSSRSSLSMCSIRLRRTGADLFARETVRRNGVLRQVFENIAHLGLIKDIIALGR